MRKKKEKLSALGAGTDVNKYTREEIKEMLSANPVINKVMTGDKNTRESAVDSFIGFCHFHKLPVMQEIKETAAALELQYPFAVPKCKSSALKI